MPITTVTYQKTYPIGPFLNEKIGIEISLGENQDAKEALSEAKKLADQFHQEANPHLYNGSQQPEPEVLPTVQVERKQSQLENDIRSCTEIKVLEAYKLLVSNKPDLKKAYDETIEKLKQNENS